MGHNKSCPKDEFNWSSYRKGLRILSPAQENALSRGHLRPLLEYVLANPDVRLDIRPTKANIYFDGGSLLRLEGGSRSQFRGVFDLGYAGGKGLISHELSDSSAAEKVVEGFEASRKAMRQWREAGKGRTERRYEQHIARANDGKDTAATGDYVIVDIEYSYARRCFDFAALPKCGLPRPRLMLGELKCLAGALNGTSGLRDHGVDFGEFLLAEGGRHVDTSKSELSEMVKQKQRLRLLAPDLPFEGFSTEQPEFLVMFADYNVRQRQLDTPLKRLREEIESRLGDVDLLKFADFQDTDDGSTTLMRLRSDKVMTSRQFDEYRRNTV
jgi:hypothetical protein